jgi:hypothetical protein
VAQKVFSLGSKGEQGGSWAGKGVRSQNPGAQEGRSQATRFWDGIALLVRRPLGSWILAPDSFPCENFHKLLAIMARSCFFTEPTPPVLGALCLLLFKDAGLLSSGR